MTQTNLTHQATTFKYWAKVAIAKHFAKMLKHEAGVIEDKDPEELHQMRVGMRRLRSAITGFAPALDLPKAASDRNVGRIARILGTLRDIDVLQDALKNQYQPLLPSSEQKSLNKALKVLQKKRQQAFKQVKTTLKRDRYQNLKGDLQHWLEEPQYQQIGEISIYEVLPDLLLPQISKLLLHPGWLVGVKIEDGKTRISEQLGPEEVEQILELDGESIHDLRKEAKRSRYNMELFTQFYGDSYHYFVKQIKKIQEVLGDIQDCFVLASFLATVFGSDLPKQVPTLLTQFQTNRHQKWQEWLILQEEFLNPQRRQDLRNDVQQPNMSLHPSEMAV